MPDPTRNLRSNEPREPERIPEPNQPTGFIDGIPSLDELRTIGTRLGIDIDELSTDETIREPETEEIIDKVFHCPECEEDQEWLQVTVSTRGYESGSYRVNDLEGITERQFHGLEISWEDAGDMERDGEHSWECGNCGAELDHETIMENLIERRRQLLRHKTEQNPSSRRQGRPKNLIADETHFNLYQGQNSQNRHKGESLPDAFAPEVISSFEPKNDPYGYALTAPCPKCKHDFMIGPEDSNIVCPKCQHEFDVRPLRLPENVQNASQRQRRFSQSFGTDETYIPPGHN